MISPLAKCKSREDANCATSVPSKGQTVRGRVPVRLMDMLDAAVRDSLLADTRYREPRIQHMLLPLQCCVDAGCRS